MLQAPVLPPIVAVQLRRARASIWLAVALLIMFRIAAPTHAETQRIPPELANAPRDNRFVLMQLAPDGSCMAGVRNPGGRFGPFCQLSINECLALPGTVIRRQPSKQNWGCYRGSQ